MQAQGVFYVTCAGNQINLMRESVLCVVCACGTCYLAKEEIAKKAQKAKEEGRERERREKSKS